MKRFIILIDIYKIKYQMLPELILEIYSHLGNTDKRRLRQTCKQFEKLKIEEKSFLEEHCEDGYDIPQKYINQNNIGIFVKTTRLDILQQLNIDNLTELAVYYHNLEVLKYTYENNHLWDKWDSSYAAANGKLECLKYLHEHGCPWDEWTCASAVLEGQLLCLKYAHEQGCPWDEQTCYYAYSRGRVDCLQYAIDNKCPGWENY